MDFLIGKNHFARLDLTDVVQHLTSVEPHLMSVEPHLTSA
jgi:hypothetical protein